MIALEAMTRIIRIARRLRWRWIAFRANAGIRRIAALRRECAMLSGSGVPDDRVRARAIRLEMARTREQVGDLERAALRLDPDATPRWSSAALSAGGAYLPLMVWHCPRCRMEFVSAEKREAVHPASDRHRRCGEVVRMGTNRREQARVWRRIGGDGVDPRTVSP